MDDNAAGKLSREEIAKIEIGQTYVSRWLAILFTLFFLVTIFIVPVLQQADEFMQWKAGTRISPVPQAWDIVRTIRHTVGKLRGSEMDIFPRIITVNREFLQEINEYTDHLEEASWLSKWLLSPAQYVLSLAFGVGNEKAYLGQGEWLFYRPDVDYVTGPGFLLLRQQDRRVNSAGELTIAPQPDPIQAVVQFHEQLADRGIELIIVPVPGKTAIHPDSLSRSFDGNTVVLQNRSYNDFLSALEANNVRVFDPSDILMKHRSETAMPSYLRTDTHWTPAAMERVAAGLADYVRLLLPPAPDAAMFRRETIEVNSLGDIAIMLKLPDWSRWPSKERVVIHPVYNSGGDRWAPDVRSDVLLLGDSYSNIYSLESMGWGASAGLAAQLSYAMNRPVDTLIRNDAGAWTTRQMLAGELTRGRDRLAGKKIVIWQFAARELSEGDWKLIDLQSRRMPIGSVPEFNADSIRALTGARTRLVWSQDADAAYNDPFGLGATSRLMGFDSDDGRGVREILPAPISCRKPMLTPDGRRVVFTDFPRGKVWVVNWDGSGLRVLADAYAVDVLKDAVTNRTWVYAVVAMNNKASFDGNAFIGRPVIRFDIDHPELREVVWDRTDISLDNFQISADGFRAGGLFPWPHAGIADLKSGTWNQIGTGCWTSFVPDNTYVAWFFDGAHRNLIFKDSVSQNSWKVQINNAPGVDGYEVYHPRWSSHRRFFVISGPYKSGNNVENRIAAGGRDVEIYLGRFSADLRSVDGWVRITQNELPDFFPDVWIDPAGSLETEGISNPATAAGAASIIPSPAGAAMGKLFVEAQLVEVSKTPSLQSIAPYRNALVVYSYHILKVLDGKAPGERILVAHWAIRDGKVLSQSRRVGDIVRLSLDSFDSHRELEGERVIMDMRDIGMHMFYELPVDSAKR